MKRAKDEKGGKNIEPARQKKTEQQNQDSIQKKRIPPVTGKNKKHIESNGEILQSISFDAEKLNFTLN